MFFSLSESLDEGGDPVLLEKLEGLAGMLKEIPDDALNYRKLDDAVKERVSEILAYVLKHSEEIDLPPELQEALLHPDDVTPTGFQNTILRFTKKLEEHKAIHKYNSAVFFSLSESLDEGGDPVLLEKLEGLAGMLKEIPDDALNCRKLDDPVKEKVSEILAYVFDHTEEIDLPPELREALLHPGELTPNGFQNTVLRFAKHLEEHKAITKVRRDVFTGLLKTVDKKSSLHKEMTDLQAQLKKLGGYVPYGKLPPVLQTQINNILDALLKDNAFAKQHPEMMYLLLNPDKHTPADLQNTVIRFAANYDSYLKQNLMFKARYAAILMMRACARELGKMARENDRQNDRGEGQSNITKRQTLKEAWHNYKEPYGYDYD